jgi:hypothetical protein
MHPCSRASWKTNMQVKRGITSHIYVCARPQINRAKVCQHFNVYSYRFLTTKKPSNRETTLTGIDFGNMRP